MSATKAKPHPDNFQVAVATLVKLEDKFLKLAEETTSGAAFKQELLYASTAIMNNDYLARCAVSNPLSLRNAFQQVAACGLTLNPANALAYIVPREGRVVLDISYRGMIRMAVRDGAIKDCIVEVVYSNDQFVYKGKRTSPEHIFDPFSEEQQRGEFVGVYVEALLPDGRLYVEAIPAREIYAARAASELWKRKQSGPWKDFFVSMVKKTAIKIARKYWPQGSGTLDQAISYLNEEGGEGFSTKDVPAEVVERYMGTTEVEDAEPPREEVVQPSVLTAVPERAEESAPQEAQEAAQQVPKKAPKQQPKAPQEAPVSADDLPPKIVKKTATLVQRAQEQGCWEAAEEYLSNWPVDYRNYAMRELTAARYAAATSGE